MTGFLGTRADVFMDLAITFFVAAPFRARHRLCGQVTYAGLWFTCITGVAMYVLCYAL